MSRRVNIQIRVTGDSPDDTFIADATLVGDAGDPWFVDKFTATCEDLLEHAFGPGDDEQDIDL